MPVSLHDILRAIGICVMLAREWWHSGVTYNPLLLHTYTNPYPTYAILRTNRRSVLNTTSVLAWWRGSPTNTHSRFDTRKRHMPNRVGIDEFTKCKGYNRVWPGFCWPLFRRQLHPHKHKLCQRAKNRLLGVGAKTLSMSMTVSNPCNFMEFLVWS